MGLEDPVGVEDADGVLGEVVDRVRDPARLVARGAAGVPVVVPAAVGELAAEVLRPPYRRGHRAHDEEDDRVGRIPEGLGIEVDSVRLNPSGLHDSRDSGSPYNDTGVQRRTREGVKRPTRPSACNAGLGGDRASFQPFSPAALRIEVRSSALTDHVVRASGCRRTPYSAATARTIC